ncbi:MAG: ComEC/Rec2 family competence protein [Leptospiraceae bacterium]|nr:ComEC/Rec2 family competence protein [Leptospiraceae bacterium]
MRTLVWKLLFIVPSVFLIDFFPWTCHRWFIAIALLLVPILTAFLFTTWFFPVLRILPGNTWNVFWIPVLFIFLGLASAPDVGRPPAHWFAFDSHHPDYDRSIDATATIQKSINPELYVAQIQIHAYQVDRNPDRWTEEWVSVVEPDASPFKTALSINDSQLLPGCQMRLRVYGRGVASHPYGGFGEYLKGMRVDSYLRISKKWHVQNTNCPGALRSRLRTRFAGILNTAGLSERSQGMIQGILLGESGWTDKKTQEHARKLGIMHLFAASGLHLGVFYGVFFLPLSLWLGRRHPAALLMPLAPCYFYLWFLGFPVSLSRAFVFLFFIGLQSVVHRKSNRYHHLANSAIVLLLFDPMGFCSLSGYLSFGAVSGILLFFQRIEASLFECKNLALRFLRGQAALTLSATILIAPLLIWTFKAYPFTSHLSNIMLVPITAVLLPPIFLLVGAQLALGIQGPLWIWKPIAWVLHCYLAFMDWLAQYSIYVTYESRWNLALLLAFLSMGLIFLGTLRSPGSRLTRYSTRLAFVIMLFGAGLSWHYHGDFFGELAQNHPRQNSIGISVLQS